MPRVILGSASPRRKELLAILLPEPFRVATAPDFLEPACGDVRNLGEVAGFVERLARAKSEAVAAVHAIDGNTDVLLTADTVVATEEAPPFVLEKPPEPDWEAASRDWLSRLSGRWHSVFTGVCVSVGGERRSTSVRTRVRFAELRPSLIDWYVRTGEPRGKAGGYAIQGDGGLLVAGLEGSFSNVVGLPLEETADLLCGAGVETR